MRTTSRKLALPSEAAFRFERVVDIEQIDWASKRTAQLITQVAGGKVAGGVVDAYPNKPAGRTVTMRLARLRALLGIEVPGEPGYPIWDGNPEVFELDPDKLGLPNQIIPAGSSFSAIGTLGFEFGGYEFWPSELAIAPASSCVT